ncbi:unnamed protein product [Vitrella brassicaformis CCMP3155]|uniref:Uncharacterized protein n=1 Tax=Vitrella brassicaformis (strain CCMP3155) TaxID=1169540 RepID=A0A0G4ED97_VITBC|nr:unnamed protein product [Vitrella brassicaformis CCMP3155]|eukprot:CEL93316.1 unnamed protein product [Vitrella brassicaformis CCMP3155]
MRRLPPALVPLPRPLPPPFRPRAIHRTSSSSSSAASNDDAQGGSGAAVAMMRKGDLDGAFAVFDSCDDFVGQGDCLLAADDYRGARGAFEKALDTTSCDATKKTRAYQRLCSLALCEEFEVRGGRKPSQTRGRSAGPGDGHTDGNSTLHVGLTRGAVQQRFPSLPPSLCLSSQEALEHARRALDLQHDSPDVLFCAATAHSRLNQHQQAIVLLDRLIALPSLSAAGRLRREDLAMRMTCRYKTGDMWGAVEDSSAILQTLAMDGDMARQQRDGERRFLLEVAICGIAAACRALEHTHPIQAPQEAEEMRAALESLIASQQPMTTPTDLPEESTPHLSPSDGPSRNRRDYVEATERADRSGSPMVEVAGAKDFRRSAPRLSSSALEVLLHPTDKIHPRTSEWILPEDKHLQSPDAVLTVPGWSRKDLQGGGVPLEMIGADLIQRLSSCVVSAVRLRDASLLATALGLRARVHALLEQWPQALSDSTRALMLDVRAAGRLPDDDEDSPDSVSRAPLLTLRAIAFYRMGRHQDAAADYLLCQGLQRLTDAAARRHAPPDTAPAAEADESSSTSPGWVNPRSVRRSWDRTADERQRLAVKQRTRREGRVPHIHT